MIDDDVALMLDLGTCSLSLSLSLEPKMEILGLVSMLSLIFWYLFLVLPSDAGFVEGYVISFRSSGPFLLDFPAGVLKADGGERQLLISVRAPSYP